MHCIHCLLSRELGPMLSSVNICSPAISFNLASYGKTPEFTLLSQHLFFILVLHSLLITICLMLICSRLIMSTILFPFIINGYLDWAGEGTWKLLFHGIQISGLCLFLPRHPGHFLLRACTLFALSAWNDLLLDILARCLILFTSWLKCALHMQALPGHSVENLKSSKLLAWPVVLLILFISLVLTAIWHAIFYLFILSSL